MEGGVAAAVAATGADVAAVANSIKISLLVHDRELCIQCAAF